MEVLTLCVGCTGDSPTQTKKKIHSENKNELTAILQTEPGVKHALAARLQQAGTNGFEQS